MHLLLEFHGQMFSVTPIVSSLMLGSLCFFQIVRDQTLGCSLAGILHECVAPKSGIRKSQYFFNFTWHSFWHLIPLSASFPMHGISAH
jgi:hypothetical protein